MKKIFLLILSCLPYITCSQITIVRSDMPYPNDIFTVKVLNQPLGINFNQTGPNHVWNYSNLLSFIERNDTFYSPWQTPPVYWLFFNGFNTTLAQKIPTSFGIGNFPNNPFINVSDIYNFYFVNNSRYELTGFGALINNIPTPVKHDTNDVIYRFPLTYDKKDTSYSTFDVNIPGIGYWKNNQRRYNHVDGWGTLYIPNDTFEVLRVKSQIYNSDSVHLDTLGGFSGRFPRPKQTEYKFLTKNGGIPVLQILTQTNQFGIESIVSIEYLKVDPSTYRLSKALDNPNFILYHQPHSNIVWLKILSNETFYLNLYDINGKIIHQNQVEGNQTYEISNIPGGLYTFMIYNEHHQYSKKIWISE